MPITPRERLARVLDGSRVPGAFSAQLSVPARDVRLTVAGAGPISFPVRAPQAKRMIASARPARFGRGERTLTDLSVRDTWEITPDQVTLTGLDWDAILAEVRDGLGLPARARLRAEPHALLVYGKGQFFLTHQDSEKDDTMIGTLVISLPSSHTGGELVVEHNGKIVACQASPTEVSVAAFYADCRHEVKPVRTGYRVTLTCNLLLEADPAGEVPAEPSAEAARYLTEHFTTSVSRWEGDDREPPDRLVYLLDHEYTQRGLSWDRLKGADAERAALFRPRGASSSRGWASRSPGCWQPPTGQRWPARSWRSCGSTATMCSPAWCRCCGRPGQDQARPSRSWHGTASGGSPRSPGARPGPMTTGRSPGPAAAAANCAAHSAGSSPTAASARWSGRSPRPAASTSRTRSAPPSCRSGMRSGSSAARTR